MDLNRTKVICNTSIGKSVRMVEKELRKPKKRRRSETSSSGSGSSSDSSSSGSSSSSDSESSSSDDSKSSSSTDSSGSESFDDIKKCNYNEWKSFVVRTYLNGQEPVRKIYEVPRHMAFLHTKDGKLIKSPSALPLKKNQLDSEKYQQGNNTNQVQRQENPKQILYRSEKARNLQNFTSENTHPSGAHASDSINNFEGGFKNVNKIFKTVQSNSTCHSSPSSTASTSSTYKPNEKKQLLSQNVQNGHSVKKQFIPNANTNPQLNARKLPYKPDVQSKMKAKQMIAQANKPTVPIFQTHKRDENNFKIPNRDASGNPIENLSVMKQPTHFMAGSTTTTKTTLATATATATATASTSVFAFNRTTSDVSRTVNQVPIEAMKKVTSDSLRSILETFWSLNSAAKLVHVKSQLDEPSKQYVHKLIKAHANLVRENDQLKKDKQTLVNVIKKVEKTIKSEMIASFMENGQPSIKNS